MKRLNRYILSAVLLLAAFATACSEDTTDPANPYEGDFALRSQAEVDAFTARGSVNRLMIEGEGITDLSSLDVAAVGTLTIRNTGIAELVLPHVTSVATLLEIEGNAALASLGEMGLRFSIGDIRIENNPVLTDIGGLMGLKKMTGRLFVQDNAALGEDKPDQPDEYGFNVIRYLISNAVLAADRVILSNNHPLAATDPSLIGQGGETGGVYSYTVKSDAEAAALSLSGKEVKNLTIEGAQVTDNGMAALASKIEVVQGTLTIDHNCIELYTGFFWNLATRLEEIGGSFVLTGNDHVNGLGGFEKIRSIGGDVTIAGNGTDPSAGGIPYETCPGQVGFDLVAGWIASGVVRQGAVVDCRYADGTPVDFSDIPEPDPYKSYTISSRDELLAFAPQDGSAERETVRDLTILDPQGTMSDNDLSFVKTRVDKVLGDFTLVGSTLTSTEQLFLNDGFAVEGGIVFRDCAQLFNLNGMKSMTAIGGDLVFENCPKIATNWGAGNALSQIEHVGGSVRLTGVAEPMAGVTFLSLKSVGGDFEVRGCNGSFWNFDVMPLREIGGSLVLADNANLNGLGGFAQLERVGGDVTVAGNGASAGYIPVASTDNQVGLELLGRLYRAGVFSEGAVFTIESNGMSYSIDSL